MVIVFIVKYSVDVFVFGGSVCLFACVFCLLVGVVSCVCREYWVVGFLFLGIGVLGFSVVVCRV